MVQAARDALREHQKRWAQGAPPLSSRPVAEALERSAKRRAGLEPDGEYLRSGVFKYPIATENERFALTDVIIRRVDPGPYEDPRFLEILARQAAAVEYVLGQDEAMRDALQQIVIGTTGAPGAHGFSEMRSGEVAIALSAGLIDCLYQTSKAIALALKPTEPGSGGGVSFSTQPQDTEDLLDADPYPVDLMYDTLSTWLYEGIPRAPHSTNPPAIYDPPIQLMINGAERFVLAHEYGHAIIDHLEVGSTGSPTQASPWDRELRADLFALWVVVESSALLDQLPPNMALQGAVVAIEAYQQLTSALSIAISGHTVEDAGSASHPPLEARLENVKRFYTGLYDDPDEAAASIGGMMVPSQTAEQIWVRVLPRLEASFRAGKQLHPMWAEM